MKISLVMPSSNVTYDLAGMTWDNLRKYRKLVDEIIVVEDAGRISHDIAVTADKYLRFQKRQGWVKAVNAGWNLATGDYTFIVNSDTYIEDGDIHDLCIPNIVTSPKNAKYLHTGDEMFRGEFFVVPKTVQRMDGMLDERFEMYFADTDYHHRTDFQQVPSVTYRHVGMATTSEYEKWEPGWMDRAFQRDKEKYEEKYGK